MHRLLTKSLCGKSSGAIPPASPRRRRGYHEDLRQHPRWAPTNRRRSWKSHPWFLRDFSAVGGYSFHFTSKKLEVMRYIWDFDILFMQIYQVLSRVLGKKDRSHDRFWTRQILPVGICLYVMGSNGSNKVQVVGMHHSLASTSIQTLDIWRTFWSANLDTQSGYLSNLWQ